MTRRSSPEAGLVPRSTRTIWQILTRYERIAHPARRERVPMERPGLLEYWQLDFKDDATVPPDPLGKQQHVVETLNTHDVGTSISLNAQESRQLHRRDGAQGCGRDVRSVGAARSGGL